MGAKRPPPPRRRLGWSAAGWWLTIAVGSAALLQMASGDVSVSTAAENGAEAATPTSEQRLRLGDACVADSGDDCAGIPNAECRRGDGKCACQEGMVADADRDRCGPLVALEGVCGFDEQCAVSTPRAVCVAGRCRCSEGLIIVNRSGEGAVCIEEKKRSLGEPCEDLRECSAPNSFCQPGKEVCACLPEFPLSDGNNQCGKAVPWNGECSFSEQCAATTEKTACKNGRCSCKFQMIASNQSDGSVRCEGGELKYGDRCETSSQCGFDHGVCEKTGGKLTCQCQPEYSVTNHLDMCGKPVKINESCEFTEQCEKTTEKTECRDGRCVCRFQMSILYKTDGTVECVDVKQEPTSQQYIDPAMIGVLAGMALMFIILCVVLHLFSKARWRENRTIFNTPNPRLMNVSLLRDSKLIHGGGGSRRGSKGSNVSATSTRSPRSPAKPPPSPLVGSAHPHGLAAVGATPAAAGSTPTLESVTVEVRDPSSSSKVTQQQL